MPFVRLCELCETRLQLGLIAFGDEPKVLRPGLEAFCFDCRLRIEACVLEWITDPSRAIRVTIERNPQ